MCLVSFKLFNINKLELFFYKLSNFTKFSGVPSVNDIPDLFFTLQNTGTPESEALHAFIESLNEEKPYAASIQIIR